MLGLDAAGKTTILYKLHIGEVLSTVPTIGRLGCYLFASSFVFQLINLCFMSDYFFAHQKKKPFPLSSSQYNLPCLLLVLDVTIKIITFSWSL